MRTRTIGNQSVGTSEVGAIGLGLMTFDQTGTQPREQLGLTFLPWSPLGGLSKAKDLAGKNPAFAQVAEARGVSPQQVALAWELALAPVVVPIPGASRPESIRDSVRAVDLELSPDEVERLSAASAD